MEKGKRWVMKPPRKAASIWSVIWKTTNKEGWHEWVKTALMSLICIALMFFFPPREQGQSWHDDKNKIKKTAKTKKQLSSDTLFLTILSISFIHNKSFVRVSRYSCMMGILNGTKIFFFFFPISFVYILFATLKKEVLQNERLTKNRQKRWINRNNKVLQVSGAASTWTLSFWFSGEVLQNRFVLPGH